MRNLIIVQLVFVFFLEACGQQTQNKSSSLDKATMESKPEIIDLVTILNPEGQLLETRINPPEGYQRAEVKDSSFARYLRQLPVKPHGSEVLYFNGKTKPNRDVYEAVVALEIGSKDLHQCADAVMRLRAEYLWQNKQYDKIHFNFTNGFRVDYSKWMQGNRIVVKGNKVSWTSKYAPSNTYRDFWKYMETIFSYAGTYSLSKELHATGIEELKAGDVFIQGGFPGHAVMVVDRAIHPQTGEKVFLLAQSYMPAQEIQVLKNPQDPDISPWYPSDFGEILYTPEWTFKKADLKRFKD
ncbi:DUF4846 domain-containing protein [Rapidithrix thailandica]|uniref:DUF4846 domain-containing protein n=1 Tax=Rapidithrix thailandica TaxID=413964 RepID=A0AAW9SDT1_9BACT